MLLMRQNEYLWSKVLKEFRKQFNIHLFIRSQRPKTTGISDKNPNWLKRTENFTFPGGLKNVEGSLPVAITARMVQSDIR